VTLRFHQMLPPQATIPSKAILPWAEKVEKESGGRIKVQRFPERCSWAASRPSCSTRPRTASST
jgi:hypothetical protein